MLIVVQWKKIYIYLFPFKDIAVECNNTSYFKGWICKVNLYRLIVPWMFQLQTLFGAFMSFGTIQVHNLSPPPLIISSYVPPEFPPLVRNYIMTLPPPPHLFIRHTKLSTFWFFFSSIVGYKEIEGFQLQMLWPPISYTQCFSSEFCLICILFFFLLQFAARQVAASLQEETKRVNCLMSISAALWPSSLRSVWLT